MNGRANCILGVCCDHLADRVAALAAEMETSLGCAPKDARKHAAWILRTFDLAPKGSLDKLIAAVAAHAREGFSKTD